MTSQEPNFHDARMGAAITVRVILKAKTNAIGGILEDGTIKVRLAAAADDNKLLLTYLAQVLGVELAKLDIIAGLGGRDKLITIIGLNSDAVQELILAQLS